MRKLIACFLLLTLLLGLCGCNQKAAETTTSATTTPGNQNYSVKDFLLYKATDLARDLGIAAGSNYLKSYDIPAEAVSLATIFAAASQPSGVVSAAFLPMEEMNLHYAIANINKVAAGTPQLAAMNALKYSTQFHCPLTLPVNLGIYLRYGNQCHVVVVFEAQENQLVTATVYPLVTAAANTLMNKYYGGISYTSAEAVKNAYTRAQNAPCDAEPTAATVNADYYANMAKSLFADLTATSGDTLSYFTNNAIVISQASAYWKAMLSEPTAISVYRFPTGLEATLDSLNVAEVQALACQQLYLNWAGQFVTRAGDTYIATNDIMSAAMQLNVPGAVANEDEVPVLIAMDYSICTVLVTFYPNEYNVYSASFVCLPHTYSEMLQALTHLGISQF